MPRPRVTIAQLLAFVLLVGVVLGLLDMLGNLADRSDTAVRARTR